MIKIYDTLARKKVEFKPITEGKVKMYVCGPTVYNKIHLGNARPITVFDTVRRYLEFKGFEVQYVQNFTDVDDKIINKANETGRSAKEVSEEFIEQYFNDANALSVRKADVHPKVTENMDEIIEFIDHLVAKNSAYVVDGDVYFKTGSFQEYGKLSKQSLEDLLAGARIEVDEKKENPLDFALWKSAKPNEVFWISPWGEGRPGWHIECSSMVKKYLGETIDIHAGGADLIFPHHENEIAQSESLNNTTFANYWMHNGYITINNEKMSKSLGNVFTVSDFLEKFEPAVLRYLILSVHYRNPINFSEDLIEQSKNSIERIRTTYQNLLHRFEIAPENNIDKELEKTVHELKERFENEMDDDFNTANAITVIFELIKKANIYLQSVQGSKEDFLLLIRTLDKWLEILGLEGIKASDSVQNVEEWVEELIKERTIAKQQKNWAKADEIREQLNEAGIILEDTPQGVRWRKK